LKVNWSGSATARFYGCNTAVNFAQNFANAQRVPTFGYEGYAYFSNSSTSRFQTFKDAATLTTSITVCKGTAKCNVINRGIPITKRTGLTGSRLVVAVKIERYQTSCFTIRFRTNLLTVESCRCRLYYAYVTKCDFYSNESSIGSGLRFAILVYQ
jgi:hypothetical protein